MTRFVAVLVSSLLGLAAAPVFAEVPGESFVHVANIENISSAATYLEHPLLDGNPDAIALVTPNRTPSGVPGAVPDSDVGLFYSTGEARWSIYNEDGSDMPEGAAFNVFVPANGSDAFVHTTTVGTVANNWSTLDHAASNDDPNALVFVTHVYAAGAIGEGDYHPESLGVWYTGAERWAIFNQTTTVAMPVGLDFHVFVAPDDENAFVHFAEADNVSDDSTFLDHPRANGDPDAILLVTQTWNPSGAALGIYNDRPVGVSYSAMEGRWGVFDADGASVPLGAAFNVVVLPEPVTGLGQAAALTLLACLAGRRRAWRVSARAQHRPALHS